MSDQDTWHRERPPKTSQNQQFGNATLTIYFHCGTSANQTLNNSSNKPTHITLQSNSRLKSDTLKLHFWIQLYTKAKDSRDNLSLILKHILSQRKLFNTHISPLVTRQVLK